MDKEFSSCSPSAIRQTLSSSPLFFKDSQKKKKTMIMMMKKEEDGDGIDDAEVFDISPSRRRTMTTTNNNGTANDNTGYDDYGIPEIPSMTSSQQTPHRRHPHNNGNGTTTDIGNHTSSDIGLISTGTAGISPLSPLQHEESPGISKLWKPASSPLNNSNSNSNTNSATTTPRRVLYPSPTHHSRRQQHQSQRHRSYFHIGSLLSSTPKLTKYFMIALAMACGTYLYLATSILTMTTLTTTHSPSLFLTASSTHQQMEMLERLANQPLHLQQHHQQEQEQQQQQQQLLQGSSTVVGGGVGGKNHIRSSSSTIISSNTAHRTRWQRPSTTTKTTTRTKQVVTNPRPRVILAVEEDSVHFSTKTKTRRTTTNTRSTFHFPLTPLGKDYSMDTMEEENSPSLLLPNDNNNNNNSNPSSSTTASSSLPIPNKNANTAAAATGGMITPLFLNTTTDDKNIFHNMSNTTDMYGELSAGGSGPDSGEDEDGPPPDNEDKGDVLDLEDGPEQILLETCDPAESWQTEAHPNCNTLHEIDMDPTSSRTQAHLAFLGQGWFRSTWRLDPHNDTSVVVKMLRLEREFLDEYYELHRRDAVAMDHLTFSPFVMNVYGYCGQSAINELAEFLPGVNALEQLDRRLRGRDGDGVLLLKLRLGLSVALGLYHVHYGIPGMPWEFDNEGNITNAIRHPPRGIRPTMAHYDINPRNIAIVSGGKPKLNDFNIAEFLRYPKPGMVTPTTGDAATNTTCGFPSRLHEPWWRAPEEMDTNSSNVHFVSEKVDVYALGAVLYHILTTHSPRGKMKKERMDGIRNMVRQGLRPGLMEPWASRKDPIVRAFRDAMNLCFHPDPAKRGTAAQVATRLYRGLQEAPALKPLAAHHAMEQEKKDSKHHDDSKKKHHEDDNAKKKKKTTDQHKQDNDHNKNKKQDGHHR